MNENLIVLHDISNSRFVSTSITNKEKSSSLSSKRDKNILCQQCGGNGYMKSTPNCYHTCLECLGRGLLPNIS